MIKLRHPPPSLGNRGWAEDSKDLWEPWMRLVDDLLEDEQLLDRVYETQGERYPQSRQPWSHANPGGGGVASSAFETHSELEL